MITLIIAFAASVLFAAVMHFFPTEAEVEAARHEREDVNA